MIFNNFNISKILIVGSTVQPNKKRAYLFKKEALPPKNRFNIQKKKTLSHKNEALPHRKKVELLQNKVLSHNQIIIFKGQNTIKV